MPLHLNTKQLQHLRALKEHEPQQIIELCKCAFDYLVNGPSVINTERYAKLAEKDGIKQQSSENVQQNVEVLLSLLIDATKANANEEQIHALKADTEFSDEVLGILAQFVTSKRSFIEGSINSANIRAYRLVNLEWRLEAVLASRSLLQQRNVIITMKLFLHMEPRNENRDLLVSKRDEPIHPNELRNRKDLMVQTDIMSLLHIIRTLEDALQESKSRRIHNLVKALT